MQEVQMCNPARCRGDPGNERSSVFLKIYKAQTIYTVSSAPGALSHISSLILPTITQKCDFPFYTLQSAFVLPPMYMLLPRHFYRGLEPVDVSFGGNPDLPIDDPGLAGFIGNPASFSEVVESREQYEWQ
ncbi:hypothetical protein NM688_g3186 [Phlebia brevispora]|uniref:Uncharacterized protein n=1 Tax=Phlebia brevispora TaxID=194682 RepID=A0ACC1T6P0_9APHY|nr:hypothetical protein NM688_g3186 [Phlebia brevispora]